MTTERTRFEVRRESGETTIWYVWPDGKRSERMEFPTGAERELRGLLHAD